MARDSNLLASIQAAQQAVPQSDAPRPKSHLPKGAVGALAAGLRDMQEAGIQEIDTALVDHWGPVDRMPEDTTVDDDELRENIKTYGQLVPVLMRPHPDAAGRYQIVYGRRRLKACEALAIKVKANVRELTDHECVIAQGQENTARKDLTFHERVCFALEIEDAGYDRTTIMAALNVQKGRVSEYLKIAREVPSRVRTTIGPAPGIGRDRWEALMSAFIAKKLNEAVALEILDEVKAMPSADRFTHLLTNINKRGARPSATTARTTEPLAGVKISTSANKVSLTLSKRENAFGDWFESKAEDLIKELHARFKQETGIED